VSVRIAVAVVVIASTAHAEPTLIGLAPATDARRAIAIGPEGQVYEPDGRGAWSRRQLGGTAAQLVTATRTGDVVIAGAKDAPPFKLVAGAWTAIYLGPHAKAIVGVGSRATAAVGKTVFALDRATPIRLADAPAPISALGASATGVVAATTAGLVRLDASTWKPIKGAPPTVVDLISDRWAVIEHGLVDLRTQKPIAWPTELAISAATAVGDAVLVAAVRGTAVELVTVRPRTLDREPVPLDPPAPIVGIAADPAGRVVLATRDGRLVVRDGGTWTTTTVHDELPAARPGPPPATQASPGPPVDPTAPTTLP
jgi:hypothetical protein